MAVVALVIVVVIVITVVIIAITLVATTLRRGHSGGHLKKAATSGKTGTPPQTGTPHFIIPQLGKGIVAGPTAERIKGTGGDAVVQFVVVVVVVIVGSVRTRVQQIGGRRLVRVGSPPFFGRHGGGSRGHGGGRIRHKVCGSSGSLVGSGSGSRSGTLGSHNNVVMNRRRLGFVLGQ